MSLSDTKRVTRKIGSKDEVDVFGDFDSASLLEQLEMLRGPRAIPSLIQRESQSRHLGILSAVLESVHCPDQLFEKYYTSSSEWVRASISGNEKTPRWIIDELVKDPAITVRVKAAENPTCTIQDFETLCRTDDLDVLVAVANADQASEEILLKLSSSNQFEILSAVVANKNATESILERALLFAQSAFSEVERRGLSRGIAAHTSCPDRILETFLNSEDAQTRFSVAQNSNTSALNLEKLSSDLSAEVRWAVFENKNSSDAARATVNLIGFTS